MQELPDTTIHQIAWIDFRIDSLINSSDGKRKKMLLGFKDRGCVYISDVVTLIEQGGFKKKTLLEIANFIEGGNTMPVLIVQAAQKKLQQKQ